MSKEQLILLLFYVCITGFVISLIFTAYYYGYGKGFRKGWQRRSLLPSITEDELSIKKPVKPTPPPIQIVNKWGHLC